MSIDLSAVQAADGPLVLNGEPLVGLVLDDTYAFSTDHASAADVASFEVTGAGYTRLTATGRVEQVGQRWFVFFDDVSSTDLSDVEDRSGVYWVRDGLDDAVRRAVGWSADPGGPVDPYEPTYPSGAFDVSIESLDELLDGLDARTAAGVAAVGGDYPAPALAEALAGFLPGGSPAAPDVMPVLYGPDTHHGPASAVGVEGLANLGTAEGQDAAPSPLVTGAIGAGAWDGPRIFGQFRSLIGDVGYPSAGFSVTASKVTVFERAHDPGYTWIEVVTVHAYSDGDYDETHDYLEIAVVHHETGLHLGVNVRCNGHLPEYKWESPDPVGIEWGVPFDLSADLNPADGVVTFRVDGVPVASGVLEEDGTDDPPALPLTLTAPAPTVDILMLRGPMVAERIEVRDHGGTGVLIGIGVVDSGGDGDQSFASHGRVWTGEDGRVALPFTAGVLPRSGVPWTSPGVVVGSGDSATWVLSGFLPYWAPAAAAWWHHNLSGIGAGAAWGFGRNTGMGLAFGFAVSSGPGAPLVIDAGTVPTGRCTAAAVLDRGAGELRLYIWTADDGLVLAGTVSASGLGAVAPAGGVALDAELTGAAAFYPRALTPLQIELLARSAPT